MQNFADIPPIEPQTLYERGMEFVKPRNKSSKVWKYFGQRVVDGKLLTKEEVVCLVCFNTYRTCGSTSPMFSHLMKMHPNEYAQISSNPSHNQKAATSISLPRVSPSGMYDAANDVKSSTDISDCGIEVCEAEIKCSQNLSSQPSSSVTKIYDQNDSHQRNITKLLIDVIVENLLSPSLVNSNSFHKLMNTIDPSYIIPDKKTISKVIIPNRYNEAKSALKVKLSALTSFSYAINRFTVANGNEYIFLSVHGISDSWIQMHYLISVLHLPKSMPFSQVTFVIKDQLQQSQNGYTPVVAATSDTSDVLRASIRSLGYLHLPCMASVIQVAVTKEVYQIDCLEPVIQKCKQISPLLHHSASLSAALASSQLEHGNEIPNACPVIDDRRWNSVYSLLSYLLKYVSIINDILGVHGHQMLVLTDEEQQLIGCCCSMLRPLADAMNLLSNENYVTSSTVMPFLDILKTDILAVQSSDSKLVIRLKTNLVKSIINTFYEPQTRDLLLQCTFLDPRFKDLNYLNNEEKLKVRETVYDRAKRMFSNSFSLTVDQTPLKKPRSSLGQLFSIRGQKDFLSAEDLYDPLEEEISAYINNECVFEIDGDHLKWWNNRKKTYPILSKVANQLLSIPATSAPSCYCFKKDGDIILRKRSSLSPKVIEVMTFLNENMK